LGNENEASASLNDGIGNKIDDKNDAGLKRGLKISYKLPESPSEDEMISIGATQNP
jgi:hypothetical protein